MWIESMVGWVCWWKGPWKFQHGIHSTNLSWIWHFATVSPFYGISRCTTRAKNDGFGNARRGPRCAGTGTSFASDQILYIKQMVDAAEACLSMVFFLSFDVDQVNRKLGYYVLVFSWYLVPIKRLRWIGQGRIDCHPGPLIGLPGNR